MSSSNKKYKNRWSLYEFFKLGVSVVLTKLFYPGAKLICYPVYMRGKKSLEYKNGMNIGYGCRFDLLNTEKTTLYLGKNFEMGDYCHIVAIDEVSIGDNCLVASKVFISDCSHGSYSGATCSMPDQAPRSRDLISRPVSIGNNVWLGENVVVLAGAHIGDGCIIGANSVVTSDIPSNSIAVGVPARVIKRFDQSAHKWVKVKEND